MSTSTPWKAEKRIDSSKNGVAFLFLILSQLLLLQKVTIVDIIKGVPVTILKFLIEQT